MDIPAELKQRFCEDCCIPIDIFTEPIFSSRIELYDRFYNTVERYNIFLKMIQENYTTYDLESTATVAGIRKGLFTIRAYSASDPKISDYCNVKITDDSDTNIVESVYIDTTELYLAVGAKRNVVASIVPDTVDNQKIVWSTSDKRVATAVGGVIVGVGKGECTITAISDKDKSKSASCIVNVTDPVNVESINFIYHETQIEIGAQEQLSLESLPPEATDLDVIWTSSNSRIANVNSKGVVTGLSAGSCAITASSQNDPSLRDTCYVLVQNFVKISQIELSKYHVNMMVGGVTKIPYTTIPEKASNTTVSWYSTNKDVVTVDKDTGEITAIGRGTATVRAVSNADTSRIAQCTVSVVPSLNVREIEIDEHDIEIRKDETATLSATISVGYNIDPEIVWLSSSERVATVSANSKDPTLKSTNIHAQDYYNDYDEVKCKLVAQIKYSIGYANFNAVNMDSSWPISCTCMRNSIYTPDMDGHTMIGVKVDKEWFTPLYHYSPEIFKNLSAWENFVSTVGETSNDHIIYSENMLKEVMECCNISRIDAYSKYILNNFYIDFVKPLITNLGVDSNGLSLAELVYFSSDEFVLDVSKLANVVDLDPSLAVLYTNRMIKLYNDIKQKAAGYTCPHTESPNHQPFPMNVRLFTLYKLKTEYQEEGKDVVISGNQIDGYVENIYYEGNQPLEFIDADPCQLPMLMRSMSYESIQENDRKFMHRGLIAEFTDDYKIHVPPISSIPDTPKSVN